ncbi:MAG: hypothetical protein STSR0008_10390 [Ignavibacterium sp.]
MKFKIIFIICLSTINLFPQEIKNEVAKIGKEKISAEEYEYRFNLTPHFGVADVLSDSLKKDFLASLIAEKLWAIEAKNIGIDTLEIIKNSLKNIEKMYVKDALYKKEVESTINITNEELTEGKFKSGINIVTKVIGSTDSSNILKLYSELINGASFDSLYNIINENIFQKDSLKFNFGMFDDEAMEDSVFKTKAGNFTAPLKNDYGWFIFYVVNRTLNVNNELSDNHIRDIIKERRAKKIGTEYLQTLLLNKELSADKDLFQDISKKIYDIIVNKTDYLTNKICAVESDIDKIIRNYDSNTLMKPFIKFKENPISLKEFLFALSYDPICLDDTIKNNLDINFIQRRLNSYVKNYIQQEIIVREGYKNNLQYSDEIKNRMKLWKDNYITQFLRNRYVDSISVSEEELFAEYSKRSNNKNFQTQVKIIEIYTSKLENIENVLKQINFGKDFKELAKIYNERKETQITNGEYDYFPITQNGELGQIAAKLKIGEVYGPIKYQDGYSIIKLIDKKKIPDSLNIPFEKVKENLYTELFNKKLNEKFTEVTAQLAQKYDVEIYEKELQKIKTYPAPMVTIQLIGFGGSMLALPTTYPSSDWMKIYQTQKKVLP